MYSVDITENIAVGSFVVRVSAVDGDEPGTRNSRIEYSLEMDDLEMFMIHRKSGTKHWLFPRNDCKQEAKLLAERENLFAILYFYIIVVQICFCIKLFNVSSVT